MLLEMEKSTHVAASQAASWELMRDVSRLSGCIPGVSGLQETDDAGHFSAVVADKLGPFKLQFPVNIAIQSEEAPRHILAELTGNDSKGQARVKGQLEGTLEPAGAVDGEGTKLTLRIRMEILGKLVSLGAGPMRRRTDEIFSEFVRRVEAELKETTIRQ
ncbi:MAG: CoxG family protein [Chloroflexota bacterium]